MRSKGTWLTELEKMVQIADDLRVKIDNQEVAILRREDSTELVINEEKEVVLFSKGRILVFNDYSELTAFDDRFLPPLSRGYDYVVLDQKDPLVLGVRDVIHSDAKPENKIQVHHLPPFVLKPAKPPRVNFEVDPNQGNNFGGNYENTYYNDLSMPYPEQKYPLNMYITGSDFMFPMPRTYSQSYWPQYPITPNTVLRSNIDLFKGMRDYCTYPAAKQNDPIISDAGGTMGARAMYYATWRDYRQSTRSWRTFEPSFSQITIDRAKTLTRFPSPTLHAIDLGSTEAYNKTRYTHYLDLRVHTAFGIKWYVKMDSLDKMDYPRWDVINKDVYLCNVIFNDTNHHKSVGKEGRCKKKIVIKFLTDRYYEIR